MEARQRITPLPPLSRPGESAEALRQAREIFARPALEETDDLLARATALSS